jgi:hypothetical protein
MTARLAATACPPPPSILCGLIALKLKGMASRLRLGRYAFRAAMFALCAVFFVFGHIMGFSQGKLEAIEKISQTAVATPSMWIAGRPANSSGLSGVTAEQPFTESIMRYRSAIGAELRRGNVDWMRVRELVEAMGELRTDIELLTLHLAYLDIYTGNSPYEVAEHWEKIGGEVVLK